MPSVDVLKQMRGTGYTDKPSDKSEDEDVDSGNRLIKLSDDEVKSLGDYEGGDVQCMVKGTMTDGGMFRVLSVSPANEGPSQEGAPGMEQMIQSVMGR